MAQFAKINQKKVQRIMDDIGLNDVGYHKQTRKYDSLRDPEEKRVKNK